jgi:hypothetical protein
MTPSSISGARLPSQRVKNRVTLRARNAMHDRQNREAASIILRDPQAYGGHDAGLVQWAYARWCNHPSARKVVV